MLRHILFCVGCFWLEINCAFKILFGECFGKETRKEKKKKGGKPPWNLAQLSPPPSLRSAQSRSAGPRAPPLSQLTAGPILPSTDAWGPRDSIPISYLCAAEPDSAPNQSRDFLAIFACYAPIKLPNQPRDTPFASKPTNSCPSFVFRENWISPRAFSASSRGRPSSKPPRVTIGAPVSSQGAPHHSRALGSVFGALKRRGRELR
jgi:hypothetical protein